MKTLMMLALIALAPYEGSVDYKFTSDSVYKKDNILKLKEQISAYDKKHEQEAEALYELKRNPKAIEKIAREKYFMKTDDEDVFVLSDDIQFREHDNDETAE